MRVESGCSPLILIFFHSEAFVCPMEIDLGLVHILDCILILFFFSIIIIDERAAIISTRFSTSGIRASRIATHAMAAMTLAIKFGLTS